VNAGRYLLGRLLHGVLLLLGVTLVSFLLMVEFGPDQTWQLLGRNPSAQQVSELRAQLGYDQPFVQRYARYLGDLAVLDLGRSNASGEPVAHLVARTLPISMLLVLPAFLIGNLLGMALGMVAAWQQGRWLDRLVNTASVLGMSLSFLVIIIVLQVVLCTPWGLNLLPARGWEVSGIASYLRSATVPGLALVLVTLGYNPRFFRAVFIEELARDHVRTARAFGASASPVKTRTGLRNSHAPVLTRVLVYIPLGGISGSRRLETYLGNPGLGRSTIDAISSGDQPVQVAVV
jgi:peptide/nickel transport system permease protein